MNTKNAYVYKPTYCIHTGNSWIVKMEYIPLNNNYLIRFIRIAFQGTHQMAVDNNVMT